MNIFREVKIGLALSGGAARSLVHVGVLKVLSENKIPIHFIAGTSGGALIGAMYAAGLPIETILELATKVNWRHLARVTIPRTGLFSMEPLEVFLRQYLHHISFRDLKIPLSVVATNLLTGEEVDLNKGDVVRAVRASCSIPQVFKPVEIEGMMLVDGGVVNYLPADVVRKMGAEMVIAVNASARAEIRKEITNIPQVVIQVLNLVAQQNARLMERYADFVICPDVQELSPLALDRAEEFIGLGERVTRAVIPYLKKEILRRSSLFHRGRRKVYLYPSIVKRVKKFI